MASLIVMVVLGVVFAYFATQNTSVITINLFRSALALPLYLLVLGSILVGLLVSSIIHIVEGVASSLALYRKDSKIHDRDRIIDELSTKIRRLEIENARLQGNEEPVAPESRQEVITEDHPRDLLSRIRHSLNF